MSGGGGAQELVDQAALLGDVGKDLAMEVGIVVLHLHPGRPACRQRPLAPEGEGELPVDELGAHLGGIRDRVAAREDHEAGARDVGGGEPVVCPPEALAKGILERELPRRPVLLDVVDPSLRAEPRLSEQKVGDDRRGVELETNGVDQRACECDLRRATNQGREHRLRGEGDRVMRRATRRAALWDRATELSPG